MNDQLYRSRDDRMIAGVAGGMAERWDSDPSLVRLLWVLAAIFTGGIAFVVYIVLAIVVPEDPLGYGRPPVVTVAPGSAPAAPDPAAALRAERAAERADAREARRAARRARREDGGRTVALVFGALFILAGVWFLLDEYVPAFDTAWLWPIALVGLGVVILAAAFRPRGEEPVPGPEIPPHWEAPSSSSDPDSHGAASSGA